MKQNIWTHLFLFLLLICTALGGIWIGQNLPMNMHESTAHHYAGADAHGLFHQHLKTLFHDDLRLTSEQEKSLGSIEQDFHHKKIMLEEHMKLANMELAGAVKGGQYTSAQAQAAVDKIHTAMGELQKLTLQHLADMKAILNAEQAQKLEEKVVAQLYRNAGK